MINRLSYLYTRARGQHTLWHPSSLSNAAHNDTAHGGSKTHTPAYRHKHIRVNTHKYTVLIFSVSLCLANTARLTHVHTNTHICIHTKISQYLIQLGNARGKAEVIIMSVFNSSVTGGCCFSVSKEHVNKQAELFKTETGSQMLTLTSSAPAMLG